MSGDDSPRSRQLDLFGPPATDGGGPLGPAEVTDEIAGLAQELPKSLRLGTSSWSFPGWEGLLWDRAATKKQLARDGLAVYARHPLLRAVGVDRTYYAPISADAFADYATAVPEDFRFLVKASSQCTTPNHRDARGRPDGPNELFLHPPYAADEVVAPYVEGLGEKGGALLFQFPPLGAKITNKPESFAERLHRFIDDLPRGPRYAVELRDGDLLVPLYFEALDACGARHCFNIHPRMSSLEAQRAAAGDRAAGPVVARWMLHAGLGYEEAQRRYAPFSSLVDEDPPNRSALAELVLDHALAGHDVIVTANNKAEGSAPLTLYRLAGAIVDLLRERGGKGA
jgi:uncharacterized protein YecE (DUF72 family)